jgi:hypothetical protein
MKTRRSTQQGSIPIPIPTPTPMENMNRRIANHGLEATPKGAPQAHVLCDKCKLPTSFSLQCGLRFGIHLDLE